MQWFRGVYHAMCNVQFALYGAWYMGFALHGALCMVHGTWYIVQLQCAVRYDAWCMVFDSIRCMVHGAVAMCSSLWCYGAWYMVQLPCAVRYGAWCMVHGAWCMHGACMSYAWCMVQLQCAVRYAHTKYSTHEAIYGYTLYVLVPPWYRDVCI